MAEKPILAASGPFKKLQMIVFACLEGTERLQNAAVAAPRAPEMLQFTALASSRMLE